MEKDWRGLCPGMGHLLTEERESNVNNEQAIKAVYYYHVTFNQIIFIQIQLLLS